MSGQRLGQPAAIALLVVCLNALWLWSPPPPPDPNYCATYYPIAGRLGILLHCDAPDFVDRAIRPSMLLDRGDYRQSRPLFVVLGTIVGGTLQRIVHFVRPGTDPRLPYYAAFVLINAFCLSAAVLILIRLLSLVDAADWLTFVLTVALVSNDVTKVYFWTVHMQMFNLLGPLAAVALGYYVATTPKLSTERFLWLTFGVGISLLVYGSLLLLLPTALMAFWLRRRSSGSPWLKSLSVTTAAAACALLPTLVWVAITIYWTGDYYNHELQHFRQIVWVADAMRDGEFMPTARIYSRNFLDTMRRNVDIAPVLIGAALVLLVPSRLLVSSRHSSDEMRRARLLEFLALFTFSMTLFFFWILGYYSNRLSFAIVPPLLCYIGVRLARVPLTPAHVMLARGTAVFASLGWVAYHVVKHGPFI